VLKQRSKKCVVTVVIIDKTEAALLILRAQIIFIVVMYNVSD